MAKYFMQTAFGAVVATAVMATPALAQSVVSEFFAKMTEAGATVTFDKNEDGGTTTWGFRFMSSFSLASISLMRRR